jgi:response regulator RpfG family c-di-GMP phosphodiesterase
VQNETRISMKILLGASPLYGRAPIGKFMTKETTFKILFVDDEQNILDALKRQLRNHFTIDVALGSELGLQVLKERGPFAVVVSDMRMPGMGGIEFLQAVKATSPDSVRIMLTGNADQDSAVKAVNEGNIFRFLNKPCPPESLAKALHDACSQYKLVIAEKELLQKTLSGSVKLLTDILSFSDPAAFGKSLALRQLAHKVSAVLCPSESWEIELAAMLVNIGLVTIPDSTISKFKSGLQLTPQELELLSTVPQIGYTLIKNIPRLERLAEIILYQHKHFDGQGFPVNTVREEQIPVGARIIKILIDLQKEQGTLDDRFGKLFQRKSVYDPKLLSHIAKIMGGEIPEETTTAARYQITAAQLLVGQVVLEDVETKDGLLLMAAGSTLTETLIERLINYSRMVGLKKSIVVDCLVPLKESGT